MLSIFTANIIATTPVKRFITRTKRSSLDTDIFFFLKGSTTSWVIATDAELRNESAEDMIIDMTPAITSPLSPIGSTVLITKGMALFGSRSGLMTRATIPIKPVTAKNGNENMPLNKVPLTVCDDLLEM